MYFSKEYISSLKQSIPLERLIGEYVELKKQGEHFVGRCPFHEDEHPSFTVFPKTQSFYCFGCQAGSKTVTKSSDHIAFLETFHKLSFPQAVRQLAEITHTPLPNQQSYHAQPAISSSNIEHQVQVKQAKAQTDESTKSLLPKLEKDPVSQEIFNLAAEFYHRQLFEPAAKFALEHLTKQRLRSPESINLFKIGYANGGRMLYDFLKQHGFNDEQLLQSGLAARRGNNILDYFFGKIIIFPHFKNGNVIGFSIKDLKQYKSKINLRLFNRDTFYNQDCLKSSQGIIMVEGESDLHSIYQFTNYTNVVALCGNQLTQPQLKQLLKAEISKVYLCLDHDAAGEKAAKTITEKLLQAQIAVTPLKWHGLKDIDLWLRFTEPVKRSQAFNQLIIEADKKSTSTSQSKKEPEQKQNENKKTAQPQEQPPSTLSIIKELFKTIYILLSIIFMLLKQPKTYIKHRKNPTPRTNYYHPRPSFTIDALPIVEKKESVPDYISLLDQYQQTHGKPLKPVNRRAGKRQPPQNALCQYCGAPAEYLSLNDGEKQVYCKVCKHLSTPGKKIKEALIRCPHCGKVLDKMKKNTEKNGYEYYKCRNTNCSFFLNNLKKKKKIKNPQKRKDFKKLHYIYRKPIIDISKLHPDSPDQPMVDLANVRASAYVIGLVCTYQAFGHSTREIASLMQEIHQVSLSHQSVKNYVDAVAYRLTPLVFNYPYDLSGILGADETYLRLLGKWGFLTWAFDPKKQVIAGLNVSEKRNLLELAKAICHSISKFPLDVLSENSDFNPLLVTDGNPVYQLIIRFLRQANIFINHKVVIGLENTDDISTDFRNMKQIIERLNKNFKKYINHSEYFGSTNGATYAAVIFVAHFNFIRKNTRLNGNIPVQLPSVVNQQNQPSRWVSLIEYAQNFSTQK